MLEYLDWDEAIEELSPHIVRIATPDGSGTGFLVFHSTTSDVVAIATAAHVVDRAHYWEQPIRVEHTSSGTSTILRPANRAIFIERERDTAAVVFSKDSLKIPDRTLNLTPEGKVLKVGFEIGWLGYPAVYQQELCFFSGRISRFATGLSGYLVDGVAINGVSGGPAFWNGGQRITLIGVVSAYLVNRATGETLPGLSLVRDVYQFRELSKTFKTVDEAKEKEEKPATPPPPPPQAPSNPTSVVGGTR